MFGYLLILFTVVPAIELALLIEIGSHIGAINTLSVIVLTGIVGATLARIQGLTVLSNIQRQLNEGALPTEEMLDGLMILVGGLVLLTPGFITDAIGLLLLFPVTRNIIKAVIRKHMQGIVLQQDGLTATKSSQKTHQIPDVEDADFYEDSR